MNHPVNRSNAHEFRNNCIGFLFFVVLFILGLWDSVLEPLLETIK